MVNFSVTGSYCTRRGNLRFFEFSESATSHGHALNQAADRIRRDRRRGYVGKMDARCVVVSPRLDIEV